jgi:uncharacterized protein (TIGR03437 family)
MIRYILFLFWASALTAQTSGTIQTVAGTGTASYSGDGGPATSASINVAVDVFADRSGNLFIADQFNHRIRKISSNGIITTVAGNGTPGYSGDGGAATGAQINTPTGVCADPSGTLYIAEPGNQRIRKVDTSGIITTFAGNGSSAYSGDGGPAASASFYNAVRCAVDASGNVLVADQSNHRIRKITPAGIVTTFAGNGAGTPAAGTFSGDGGSAITAGLNNPTAICIDSSGSVYIADQFNQRIRKVASNGTITTIAGTGSAGFGGDGGSASSALLNYPGGIAVDSSGDLYFNDDVNFRTRMISAAGIITTVAGTGSQGFSGDGGAATSATLNGNFGITLDLLGNLYIADSTNNRIREVYGAVPGQTPIVTSAGFTNGASFVSGGSPGAIATLFGQHLSRNVNGVVPGSTVPLPNTVAGTSITIDGKPAPIFSVVDQSGSEQISFQVPVNATIGSNIPLVINNGFTSATIQVPVAQVQPGIFTVDGTNAAALHANYSLISSTQPATAGETILVYCTGLGATNPAVAAGSTASTTVLSYAATTFTAAIAGQNAPVVFAGLAPGFIGLGQVNIMVPSGVPSGSQTLILTGNSAASKAVKLQMQ